MAKIVLALVAALAIVALCSAKAYNLDAEVHDLFRTYNQDFGITFNSNFEEAHRFRVFSENVKTIKKLNAEARREGLDTTFGLNEFTIYSEREFQEVMLGTPVPASWVPKNNSKFHVSSAETLTALPDSFDWRDHKPAVVTDVKNQKSCGSCWSFSTTGNIEGQWALAGNDLVPLSEQQFVDCDHTCNNVGACDSGCNGGLMELAFQYAIKNGVESEADYPYTGTDGTCSYDASKVTAKISSYKFIASDVDQIRAALQSVGPLSIAADATTWQFYTGGIIAKNCGTRLNHGILLVGWGVENNVPYWIIKNSWGTSWGENGYLRVGRDKNLCGVQNYVITSQV